MLAGVVGSFYGGNLAAILEALLIVVVLGVLEFSISFDNAIVNATVLKDMTPVWQRRFLTWGIAIAVFGMRLVFPLAIVSVIGGISPWESLHLALFEPGRYQELMLQGKHQLAAFGGAFLFCVGFEYFFDEEKDVHWIQHIEKAMVFLGRIEAFSIGFVLLTLLWFTYLQPQDLRLEFLEAGILGILTFLGVQAIGDLLSHEGSGGSTTTKVAGTVGLGGFIYLEVLDASFSFDGVIGAFAVSNNLLLITLGLGIGAIFVRSLTVFLVQHKTLDKYAYLEHGAFYAILVLASIMFLDSLIHVPEYITAILSVIFILVSFWSSLKYNEKNSGAS